MRRPRDRKTLTMDDAEARQDPFAALGSDLLGEVLQHLMPRHLLKCALVSKGWHEVANRAPLWRTHCQEAWKGKTYNPAHGRADLTWKQCYLLADADRKRVAITHEELTSFVWKFRFKRTAGAWWLQIDPYWVNNKDETKMMRRRFTTEHTLVADGEAGDVLMGDAESMRWRFTRDGRVQVEEYPALTVKRGPNWGWMMENLWVVFTAECPPPGAEAVAEVAELLASATT